MKLDRRRIRPLNNRAISAGKVVYWMSRDQRMTDNWALLYAVEQANQRNSQLEIVFVLSPSFGDATLRAYDFMLEGLLAVAKASTAKGIGFRLELGSPKAVFARLHADEAIGLLVTDFSPLKQSRIWKDAVAQLPPAVHEIDAHNIIPPWIASTKAEYSAATIRPKIYRELNEWLLPFPVMPKIKNTLTTARLPSKKKLLNSLKVDRSIASVVLPSGSDQAHRRLDQFMTSDLSHYAEQRNNPAIDVQSGLSPYLHFGQIAPQRVALAVGQSKWSNTTSAAVFLEELIVRRELAENFCFYNQYYDSPKGYPDWAKKTLAQHQRDPRPAKYSQTELESAETADVLWNTAQTELRETGKIHGYLRMYWAKQLLRWTNDVQEAHSMALLLNDRYQLDGRDPNGYVGIAWALGGVHDRPWPAQPIFGTVRSMSFASTSKKFSLQKYQARIAAPV